MPSIVRKFVWVFALSLLCGAPVPDNSGLALAASKSHQNAKTDDFATRLVAAARRQKWVPVIYNPSYRKLDYPMGDVPWYFGVCTDVVVRAYRKLGIDLQQLVHQARVGSGDRNIDHRRVNVLRKFFASRGRRLKVSKNPSDYRPGDIVTYHVPDGRFSKTHIAIVSDAKSWGGVPLVIHNRGFGVSEENWLFAAKITGHYRYKRAPHIATR